MRSSSGTTLVSHVIYSSRLPIVIPSVIFVSSLFYIHNKEDIHLSRTLYLNMMRCMYITVLFI